MTRTSIFTAIGLLLLATGACSSDDDFNLPACYAAGTCGPDGGDGSTGSTGSGQDPQGGGSCDIATTWVAPTVVLLIDQSGSMSASFGTEGGVSRWDAVYNSLFDPTEGVANTMADSAQLGLALYTNDANLDTCPQLVEVSPTTDFTELEQAYAANEPNANTPTGESIMAVADALQAGGMPGPKHIILATDGVPDTCEQPNPDEGEPIAISGARYAYDMGITTHVIGIGLDVGTGHLQDMANAGAGEPATGNVLYHQALEPSILTEKFDYILSNLKSCTFVLASPMSADATVTLDGSELTQSPDNGWTAVSATEIELVGGACDLYAAGSELVVSGSCPATP